MGKNLAFLRDVRPQNDKATAYVAAQAITAALLARERSGQGQHVRLSMLEAIVSFLWHSDMSSQTFIGDEFPQAEAQSFIDLIYETKDGYISVAVQSDRQWRNFCNAVGHPEWLEDPRFLTPALRQENIDDRLGLTQDVLATDTSAHWLDLLDAADVPCVPVLRRSEMVDHPQVRANGIVIEAEHDHAGRLRQARPAATFSGTPVNSFQGAPALGQHNHEVLREAGFDDAEIAHLEQQGVLHHTAPGDTP